MEILLKSTAGGVLIGTVLLATKMFGHKVGGILAVIPLAFTLSLIFTTAQTKNSAEIHDFLLSSAAGIVLYFPFLATLYILNKNPEHYWLHLVAAYAVWLTGAFLWVFVIRK